MKLPQGSSPKTNYVLHCDFCDFHLLTNGKDLKLAEIVRGRVQKQIPGMVDGKKIESKFISKPKQFKCPKCGRGVTARISLVKMSEHQKEPKNAKSDEDDKSTGRETGSTGQPLS